MIDISILRAMVGAGATIEIVLAAIEADQKICERRMESIRQKARMARERRGNGNGAHRTVNDAIGDLLAAARSDPVRN